MSMNTVQIDTLKARANIGRPDLPWTEIVAQASAVACASLSMSLVHVLQEWCSLAVAGKKLPFEDGYPSPEAGPLTASEFNSLLSQ